MFIGLLNRIIIFIFCLLNLGFLFAQEQYSIRLALLKYKGGGDWYADPTALTNLAKFCNKELGTNINPDYVIVEANSKDIFNYPYVFMTGHGNVVFTPDDIVNLRNYLLGGGFLHIDDCYGMDPFIRRELKKLFPEQSLVELAYNHPIFHQKFRFEHGLPKIHEHDGKPPQAFGIFVNERLVLLYTYETDLGDGWEDPEVHNDPEEIRLKALQMGANIISFVFSQ